MSLSKKDLSAIAKEFVATETEKADDKASIPDIENQILQKNEQAARVRIPYDNANSSRIIPYQSEHRWLNGTTYTTISDQQIIDAGNRTAGNIFFPVTWGKTNAMLTPSGNGNPKTTSTGSENSAINSTIENGGLIALINLIRNGQSSAMSTSSLNLAYSPGDTTITTFDTGFTSGRLLYLAGGGTSAVVKISSITDNVISIVEVVPPAGVMPPGSTVIENIPGFSNSERQSLSSALYSRIISELSTKITASVNTWVTSLTNQLVQLDSNIDSPSEITDAKTNVNSAKSACSTWLSLPTTGLQGRFADSSLNDLATAYTKRNTEITARINQIITALGSVAQDAQGNYSGSGLYLQRFKTMNFIINGANGPLYQITGLMIAKDTIQNKITNSVDKMSTYNYLVRYSSFASDPSGSSVRLNNVQQFSNGDSVIITANELPPVECSIISVSGDLVTLSIDIPKEYTKSAKSGLIKTV